MWIHKLRKKKIQFILIGIILLFASAIFSACLSFAVETGNYAAGYFAKQNSPDVFANIASGAPAEELLAQAEQNPDFTRIVTLSGYQFKGKLTLGGRDITPGYYHFYALTDVHKLSWQVVPTAGQISAAAPASGEVWVASVYADQKNIRVGDKITLPGDSGGSLTVSALIDDGLCPSTMFGVYPFYVSESTLAGFSGGVSTQMIAINSKTDYSSVEAWLHGRPTTITNALMDTFNVSQLLMSFTMFTLILGSIGMLSAVMIFAVTLVIIRFLIKNNLLKEYRSIGIYKALGFSDRQIVGFYLKCYALVGAVGLILGSAAGLPLSYLIGSLITKYIGHFYLTYVSGLLALGSAAVLFGLLLFFVWQAHRRIRQITPVQALQLGVTSSPKKLTRSVLKSAYSPLATAINDLCKHRSLSAMFVLTLTVSFYLSTFFLSINYTCNHIAQNADIWFGIPKADCYVSGNLSADNIAAVGKDPAVAELVYGTSLNDVSLKAEGNSKNLNFNDSAVSTWNDFSNPQFFRTGTSGRPPQYDNEIAVSSGTAKENSLAGGDYVTLAIGNTVKSYLITGVYDNMMHANKTIEMTPQALAQTGAAFEISTIAVNLKDGADYSAFAGRIKDQLGLDVGRSINVLSDSIAGVATIMNPVTAILVAVFIAFSLLNIINLLLTAQLDNRRKFGIMKALGFTTGYIGRQSLCRTMLLSLVSAVLALGLHWVLSPRLFYAFININALSNSALQLALFAAFLFACILVLTLLFCLPLRKVSPVDLMEE